MFSLRSSLLFSALAAGFSGGVFAQSLSSQCQSTLAGVVVSSGASCLNAQALAALATASSNTSLVGPINNWLGGFCSQPACSNATLSNIVTTVLSGCQSDLQSLLGPDQTINTQDVISAVQQAFPTVRQIGCLKDSSNSSELCVTEILTNVQSSVGTLSETNLQALFTQIMAGSLPNIPTSTLCNDCTKEAFNLFREDYPTLVNTNVQNTISQECGASFVDGSTPSDISQSANTAIASADGATGNGAFAISGGFVGVGVTSVLTLLSALATLA